jgi:hypothetical protein
MATYIQGDSSLIIGITVPLILIAMAAIAFAIGIHLRGKRKLILSNADLEEFFNGMENYETREGNDYDIYSRMPYNKKDNEIGKEDFEIGTEEFIFNLLNIFYS